MSDENKLRQLLSKYKHPDRSRRDVWNAVQQYKGLMFNLEPFIFNDGTCMDLLNVAGTIPVLYKGCKYNIPVCAWLMDTYPNNAPLCFVKPTADMLIKVSNCVDNDGKIYLRYLHEWNGNGSNLLKLIKVMCATFSECPPVYAKSRDQPAQQPPYPTSSFMPHQPDQQSGTNFLPYPAGNPFPSSFGMPPYPPTSTPYPPAANSGYPASSGPGYPQYSYNQYPYPNAQGNAQPYPGYPPTPPSTNTSSGGTITEEHINASLRSAVEDKLRRRLRELFSQNQAELETLKRTQQELVEGKNKIDDILMKLGKEEADLDKNIGILEEKNQELEQSIARLSEQDGVDPDEAVMTTAPLYYQLLIAYAEEATTEDSIYYMGEALRTGVIDLDSFLKHVRALSRKQFTLRALMQKCRQKAGLAY